MIEMSLIHEKICLYFKVDYLYPFQRSRKRKQVYVRQLFHYISKNVNRHKLTYDEIGNYLGDIIDPFDHATVMNSCKKIKGYMTYDKHIVKDVENILKMLPEHE